MEEQGIRFAKYLVIPRTLIFLFNADNVLLLKGAPEKKIWAGYYNGIGGHIEPGEDSLSSARRELWEETGLDGIRLDLCGQVMIDTGASPGVALFVFKGQTEVFELIASDEGIPEWIEIQKIPSLKLVKDLYQLLPRVIAWHKGQDLIHAKYTYSKAGELIVSFAD